MDIADQKPFVILEIKNENVAVTIKETMEQDVELLQTAAKQLNFGVFKCCVSNMGDSSTELRNISENIGNVQQFVCCVLSNVSNLTEMDLWENITQHFNGDHCQALIDKPKAFVIQTYETNQSHKKLDGGDYAIPIRLPVESEFFIILSTAKLVAEKPPTSTPFIKILTDELCNEQQKSDFSKVATKVNQRMLEDDPEFRTVPINWGRLTRPFILREGKDVELGQYAMMDQHADGLFVIFKMKDFEGGHCDPTWGSNADAEKLSSTMELFGFHCEIKENFSRDEIKNYLKKVQCSSKKKTLVCFGCAVLTHGKDESLVTFKKGEEMKLSEFTNYLKNINCPKFFLIGACRGTRNDMLSYDVSSYPSGDLSKSNSYKELANPFRPQSSIPERTVDVKFEMEIDLVSDFLIAYATTIGYIAYGNDNEGSIFVQEFCSKLNDIPENQCKDITQVLTEVNKSVADINVPVKEQHSKQMPCTCSTLHKGLMFHHRKYTDEEKRLYRKFKESGVRIEAEKHFCSITIFEIFKEDDSISFQEMYIKCYEQEENGTSRDDAEKGYNELYVNCLVCKSKPTTKSPFLCMHSVFCDDCAKCATICAKPHCKSNLLK